MFRRVRGCFISTYSLPHGHYAKWSETGLSVVPYYQYPATLSNAKTNLEAIIQKSIEDQLISDVPLGTFMSGGIDSTLVTYYTRQKALTLDTFNIGSIDPQYDESKFGRRIQANFLRRIITPGFLRK
ncbi:MAG: asparagine synthase-related protein [Cytophagales bacterium]|nr:asparagine synthase-related protein [Cytophagales bacterium]